MSSSEPEVDVVLSRRAVDTTTAGLPQPGESSGAGAHFVIDRDEPGRAKITVRWPQSPPLLSDVVSSMEQLGLRVADHEVRAAEPGTQQRRVDEFTVATAIEISEPSVPLLEEALAAVWSGRTESDRFNRLVLTAGLTWREVLLVRALFRYLSQAGLAASQRFVEDLLASRPHFTRLLVELFRAMFDPGLPSAGTAELARAGVLAELDLVTRLDEDRVLRGLTEVVEATLRTNFFQPAPGSDPAVVVLKLDPGAIAWLPRPKPQIETFVYTSEVEGLHVRAGRIARGGLRWSDRSEDYRDEVLGLMRAQIVKNAVIVPTGAKGVFVVKRNLDGLSAADRMQAVRRCYTIFIRGLLSVTDNKRGEDIVPPPGVRVRDEPDPYLVVAADKGTATFSDLANETAIAHGFWLGDAFASGGSSGYDHKALGVTARGAWVSVQRHFAELGVDLDETDITVVGVGDMSGDVFGNGMLLSRHLKIVGAFDGRHIFLDPDPDPEESHRERRRLFELERSSWADYDTSLISAGGGVYSRSAKKIDLSPQVRERLDIQAEDLTPGEVVRALLRAPVDLIWNGGIGTYIKARSETDRGVADRANDQVRVDAADLRCKVIGEGGNLGLTPAARIEYARLGGRVNADFIDNSAGVGTSDLEVNVKLLLNLAADSRTLGQDERNQLLNETADNVVDFVLDANRQQTLAISVATAQAPLALDRHQQLIRRLERLHGFDRRLESLPSDDELDARRLAGEGLARPEVAVLLAVAKNVMRDLLLESNLPDDPWLRRRLVEYFPAPAKTRCGEYAARHPLAREIIATGLANDVVNHVGPGFVHRLQERTGAQPPDSVRAFTVAAEVLGLRDLWRSIDVRRDAGPWPTRVLMFTRIQVVLADMAAWLLYRRKNEIDIGAEVATFAATADELRERFMDSLPPRRRRRLMADIDALVADGASRSIAREVVTVSHLGTVFDLVEVAAGQSVPVATVSGIYHELSDELDIDWLHDQITDHPGETHWELMAKADLRDQVHALQRGLVVSALTEMGDPATPQEVAHGYLGSRQFGVQHHLGLLAQIRQQEPLDLAMITAAVGGLHALVSA